MSTRGIDVSEFQGIIDWEQVKASGVQFAMLRAGYGYGTIDNQFRRNAAECNRIGLPIGVYWFCYALTPADARLEAEGCLNTVSPYRLDYPICYDIEQATLNYAAENGVTVDRNLATQFVQSFCNRIEAGGYYAMYYSNRNFLDNYLSSGLSERYALWYARYNSTFDGTDCGIWQYTSSGSVPGISGNVDLDTGFIDYPAVIKNAGLNHLNGSTPPPAPAPSPDYITYVIQPGDTLSGIAAKYGTTYQTLAALNGLRNPDLIYAGNTLRIPESGNAGVQYYTIQPGDTLSEIALRFGTTVSALQALNGISDPNVIYAGNTLRIN